MPLTIHSKHWRFALLVFLAVLSVAAHAASAREEKTLLFIPYRGDDHSFSEAAYRGYERLRKDGYAVDVVQNADQLGQSAMLAIIDRHYAAGVRSFILAGAEMSAVATTAARRHPDAYFATLSGTARGTNVINYCLDCRELGGLLAGQLAVRLSKSGIVGFVGGVMSVEAAEAERFKATVLHTAPGEKVLVDWTGNWSDVDKAAQLTDHQIGAGADVIVADANHAVIAAADRYPRVKVIGWMTDTSRQDRNVAVSVIIHTDVVFRRFIGAAASGRFKGGDYAVDSADKVWVVEWPKQPF
ncbi:BMP family ABC transporter substrate-binding protein [Dyella monticola]|nr:BMP family ABC transporter substrate-binding protein [Dyella monticola]